MYHLVYLTTNLINGKFYVGVHSTWNEEDGYLGSGTILKQAIKNNGKKNFERKILFYCLSRQEALDIEYRIVNLDFIQNKSTYNISFGGRNSPHCGFFISDVDRLGKEKAISKALKCSITITETLKNKTKEQKQVGIDKFSITMKSKSDIEKETRIYKITQSNKNKTEEERNEIIEKLYL